MDKLQVGLDKSNTSKLSSKNWAKTAKAKTAKDQVAILQHEVQELQSQAQTEWLNWTLSLKRRWPRAERYSSKDKTL